MSKTREPNFADSYKVGYKKPPKHTQFKPGKSGNPTGTKGKTAGGLNLPEMIERVLTEKQPAKVGGKIRRLNTLELGVLGARQKVVRGDIKTALRLIDYWATHAYTIEKEHVHTEIVVTFVNPDGSVNEALTESFNKRDVDDKKD